MSVPTQKTTENQEDFVKSVLTERQIETLEMMCDDSFFVFAIATVVRNRRGRKSEAPPPEDRKRIFRELDRVRKALNGLSQDTRDLISRGHNWGASVSGRSKLEDLGIPFPVPEVVDLFETEPVDDFVNAMDYTEGFMRRCNLIESERLNLAWWVRSIFHTFGLFEEFNLKKGTSASSDLVRCMRLVFDATGDTFDPQHAARDSARFFDY